MQKRYKIKAKVKTPGDDGRWYELGIVVVDDETNKLSMKLDVIPAAGWDGWASGFLIEKEAT